MNPDGEDDEANRKAREALQRAANNLKDMTGGLLRAAKVPPIT